MVFFGMPEFIPGSSALAKRGKPPSPTLVPYNPGSSPKGGATSLIGWNMNAKRIRRALQGGRPFLALPMTNGAARALTRDGIHEIDERLRSGAGAYAPRYVNTLWIPPELCAQLRPEELGLLRDRLGAIPFVRIDAKGSLRSERRQTWAMGPQELREPERFLACAQSNGLMLLSEPTELPASQGAGAQALLSAKRALRAACLACLIAGLITLGLAFFGRAEASSGGFAAIALALLGAGAIATGLGAGGIQARIKARWARHLRETDQSDPAAHVLARFDALPLMR